MRYVRSISFPDRESESGFFISIKRKVYDSFYPFQVLSARGLKQIDFEPITILYGGNGSGKTTALNVVSEKIGLRREANFNKTNFLSDYLSFCEIEYDRPVPENSLMITSDDVFDYTLNLRSLNDGLDLKREELFEEYLHNKYAHFQLKSLDDYEQLRKSNLAKSKTQSKYVRHELMDRVREFSNGENAFRFFTDKIQENAFYVLDEPENSLSPKRQLELCQFLEDSARFFGCQFLIATHSPFILSLKEAKIYDLDADPATVKKWTELENIQTYYRFFKDHESEF